MSMSAKTGRLQWLAVLIGIDGRLNIAARIAWPDERWHAASAWEARQDDESLERGIFCVRYRRKLTSLAGRREPGQSQNPAQPPVKYTVFVLRTAYCSCLIQLYVLY